ncbi:uncharacterized protein G2W53_026307 [Senna tora]|uniref:Uncharacterized protein n=1 Tax=Senna tora TaxID=362788 RepID=A0A834WFJ7_9FABA|nr:uncharacterized protein G2W53_026307 [Senna tora]
MAVRLSAKRVRSWWEEAPLLPDCGARK